MKNNISFFLANKRPHLILMIACLAFYGNTIFNDYSFDDDLAVTDNSFIQKGMRGIPGILTAFYTWEDGRTVDYRPVPAITFALEKEFFGNNPHVSHLLNVILYIILILIIYSVLNEVFQLHRLHPLLPLVITLLYAVHPSHTEAVASIKNRDEILSMLFAMSALICTHKFYLSSRHMLAFAAIIFMALSLLSKLTSVPVIGIILLNWYYNGFQRKKSFVVFIICLLTLSAGYFSLVIFKTSQVYAGVDNPVLNAISDTSLRLGAILQTLLFYFKFMLYPYPFRFYYWHDVFPFLSVSHPLPLLSFFLHFTILLYGFLLLRRKDVTGFFILAYLINIFLFSNVIPNPVIVSERSLFMPSLWFIATVVLVVYKAAAFDKSNTPLHPFQKMILTGGAVVFFAYAGLTIHRNLQWMDRLSLTSADMPYLQNSARANSFYAEVLEFESRKVNSESFRFKYIALAKKHYKLAIQLAPSNQSAFYKLGMIYEYDEQNHDSAFYYFNEGYHIDSTFSPVKFQLAKQFYLRGNYHNAEKLFSVLYKGLPGDTFTLFFYSRVLHETGKEERAYAVNDELMRLTPHSFLPYLNAGTFYRINGDTQNAAKNFETAIRFGFRDEEVYNFLLNYYSSTNQNDKLTALKKISSQR